MLKITATNYDELVARADKPVLLDFWAEWCGPCRMVSPVVEEIAASHPEIAVGKVNVDEEPELAQAFRVQSIPMLVLLRDNAVVAAAVGAQSKEQLEQKLGLENSVRNRGGRTAPVFYAFLSSRRAPVSVSRE